MILVYNRWIFIVVFFWGLLHSLSSMAQNSIDTNIVQQQYVIVNSLEFNPLKNKAQVSKNREIILGKKISIEEYFASCNYIIEWYENNGYPFANIQPKDIEYKDNTFEMNLDIESNNHYKFDSIIVKGDVKISDSFLRNYFQIHKKKSYSEKLISNIERQANQLIFASMSTPAEVIFTIDECHTYLYLNKRKTHSFDGIIGFVPADENSKSIKLTGDVKLKLNNIFARGESLAFEWRSYESSSQDLFINTSLPYIFNTPFGSTVNFKLDKKDSSFIKQDFQAGINYYFSALNHISLFYRNESSSAISANNQYDYSNFKANSYGLQILFDKLNEPILPTNGYKIISSVAYGKMKRIKSENKENMDKYNFNFDIPFYRRIYKNFIFHSQLSGSANFPTKLHENEMERFGGFGSLRGFDQNVFSANLFAILNTEFRFMLERYSYLSIFWNGAYYEKNAINSYSSDFPWGLGAGIAFNTPAGIFSLQYAIGKEQNNPFDFRSSKIHFGITGMF
ncbi:MAG: BamA/TamA family outer membrane protein [Bacteroidales bacterium]|jgi:outer membrane protein assembly factor BamA|nr:BamA/TamA family outer membrane protein [Bacteroidales bacterium]